MNKKFWTMLLVSTCWTMGAFAGLPEAVQSFEKGEYETAYPELLALSEEGNTVAAYYLGRMYQDGLGVTADKDKALHYFEMADKAQNPDAAVALGRMAIKGEGIAQNNELGLQYLKKAAYAGNENALYELGQAYEKGEGVEKNYTYAFGFYYMGALKGDKRAQLKVGKYYLQGRGIPQDYNAAVKWYVRSANQGYIPAQQEWANLRVSHPRLRNPLDAYSWFSILAAYNSDSVGQEAAARREQISRSFDGAILAAQQKKIMEWRPVPASQSVPAKERLEAIIPVVPGFNDDETTKTRLEAGAALHSDGTNYGVNGKMIETAVSTGDRGALEKAIEKSAEKGQIKAFGYYGDLLRNRFGDVAASVTWYRKGADAGDAYSQYQLGKAYCEGRGINPPDIATCYGWMLIASKTADKNLTLTVRDAIQSIEGAATTEELEKGKTVVDTYNQQQESKSTEKQNKKSPGLFNLF